MIHLRLSTSDIERLGCPEWLDIDLYSVTAREAAILQRGFDLDGVRVSFEHPGVWRKALSRGDMAVPEFPALLVLLWLALRRAGISVDLATLDFDVDGLDYKNDPPAVAGKDDSDAEASPGKDDEPEPMPSDSEPGSASTA